MGETQKRLKRHEQRLTLPVGHHQADVCMHCCSSGRRNERERRYRENMSENSPNLMKDTNVNIQKTNELLR